MNSNKTQRSFAGFLFLQILGIMIIMGLHSCKEKDLEVQGDFTVEAKVVRTPASAERKVEIRVKVTQYWPYTAAQYYVQYVPVLGNAMVSMSGQPMLQANQRYRIPLQEFIVFHNSSYSTIQKFRIAVTDELGNKHEMDFYFEIEQTDHGNNPGR